MAAEDKIATLVIQFEAQSATLQKQIKQVNTLTKRTDRQFKARLGPEPRLDDDQMAQLVPRDSWRTAIGPAGTVLIADTVTFTGNTEIGGFAGTPTHPAPSRH